MLHVSLPGTSIYLNGPVSYELQIKSYSYSFYINKSMWKTMCIVISRYNKKHLNYWYNRKAIWRTSIVVKSIEKQIAFPYEAQEASMTSTKITSD